MSSGPRSAPSLDAVRPYGDHLDDGLVQLSFTLPVDHGPLAREAALALVRDKMGLDQAGDRAREGAHARLHLLRAVRAVPGGGRLRPPRGRAHGDESDERGGGRRLRRASGSGARSS